MATMILKIGWLNGSIPVQIDRNSDKTEGVIMREYYDDSESETILLDNNYLAGNTTNNYQTAGSQQSYDYSSQNYSQYNTSSQTVYPDQQVYQSQVGSQGQNLYPVQVGYQEQNAYQYQAGYQGQNVYQQTGYQEQNAYQGQTGYQAQNTYNTVITPDSAVMIYRSYISKMDTVATLWLIIGIIQFVVSLCTIWFGYGFVTLAIGIWNIVQSNKERKTVNYFRTSSSGVVQYIDTQSSGIAALLINIFLLTWLGIIGAAMDMSARSFGKKNREAMIMVEQNGWL